MKQLISIKFEKVCSTRGKETANDGNFYYFYSFKAEIKGVHSFIICCLIAYTCRQPFGASCKSNSDCANSLDCVEDTHLCGCNEGVNITC